MKKNQKIIIGVFAAALVVVVGASVYFGGGGQFQGFLGKTVKVQKSIKKDTSIPLKPFANQDISIPKKPLTRACKESDWSCTEFAPVGCPVTEQRMRSCELINASCGEPDAVKPVESEVCEYINGEVSQLVDSIPGVLESPARSALFRFYIVPENIVGNEFDISGVNFDVQKVGQFEISNYKLYINGILAAQSDTPSLVFDSPWHFVPSGNSHYFFVDAEIANFEYGNELTLTLQQSGIVTDANFDGLPIVSEIGPRECGEPDFSCTPFTPTVCPASGERSRTCNQHVKNCIETGNYTPSETEVCS